MIADIMTIPEIIVMLGITSICVYGLAQWVDERQTAKRQKDFWEDGWPS